MAVARKAKRKKQRADGMVEQQCGAVSEAWTLRLKMCNGWNEVQSGGLSLSEKQKYAVWQGAVGVLQCVDL